MLSCSVTSRSLSLAKPDPHCNAVPGSEPHACGTVMQLAPLPESFSLYLQGQ